MTTQINTLKSGKCGKSSHQGGFGKQGNTFVNDKVAAWHLVKSENDKELGEIMLDKKQWFFCEIGHAFDDKNCGMYDCHRPREEDIIWQESKDVRKSQWESHREKHKKGMLPVPQSVAKPVVETKKLALSECLQASLFTQDGMTQDSFQELCGKVYVETRN